MRLVYETHHGLSEADMLLDLSAGDDRSVEVRLRKSIFEAQLQLVQYIPARMQRNRSADRLRHGPQLIDAVAMVAMRVRDDHAVKLADLGCEQLLAKVRPAVDQHPLS